MLQRLRAMGAGAAGARFSAGRPPSGEPPEEGERGDLGPPPPVFREVGAGGEAAEPPPYEVGRGVPRGPRRWWLRLLVVAAVLLVLFVIANIAIGIYVDRLWFDELGYRGVFNTRIGAKIWLFFAGFGIAFLFILGNMALAWRLRLETATAAASPFQTIGLVPVRRVAVIAGALIALFLGIIFGAVASGQWEQTLQFMKAEPFGVQDAEFGRDVGFYVFKLEALQFFKGWAVGVTIVGLLASVGVYGFRWMLHAGYASATRPVRIHAAVLLAATTGLFVWGYWLARFELVVSEHGTVFGATYTDANVRTVALLVMMGVGSLLVVALVSWPFHRRLTVPGGAIALLVLASLGGNVLYPTIVQRFTVEPSELERERGFIARNIEATRAAFRLDRIVVQEFAANDAVGLADAEANPEALRNVRVWDHRPLNDTLNTIQTIRPLYVFPDVDVDRYQIGGESQQVFLAARELSQENLQPSQLSWVNRRLQFTHGFGVTVTPVDGVTSGGEPEFVVADIPPTVQGIGEAEELAIEQPRIYFGEATDPYVIVNSESEEFDFPLTGGGDGAALDTATQARNRYDGSGGIPLGGFFKRLALAWNFQDFNILVSGSVDSESRLLFRRDIQVRVRELAPFLQLDEDPYIVIGAEGRLFWIQDAYTTSDWYPYSQPHVSGLNYIRNSVKVVVDAFNGTVDLYIIDESDPIIRVWAKIFPDLFRPEAEFPADLRAHWRYPQDLFQVQAEQYLTYHIVEASTLFNREDMWAVPQEVLRKQTVPLEPYYVTLRLPDGAEPEFLLILPLTPRNRQNAISWLAGRSDGENFGELFAFRFPAGRNVVGPAQIEARIGQEPEVSTLFTLLGQEGSEVVRGNLLFIPVGDSYIYVEPLYVQAETSRFPQLKFVIVVNGDTIALEDTLEEAALVALGAEAAAVVSGTPAAPAATAEAKEETAAEAEAPDEVEEAGPALSGTAAEIAALIKEAQGAFAEGAARLAAGDFAGYGAQLERLEQALEALREAAAAFP